VPDGPSQAPSGVLVKSSLELGGSAVGGGKELRSRALQALNVGFSSLDQGVFWYATQVGAMNAVK